FAHSISSLTPSISIFIYFSCTITPTTEIYTLSLHDALPISGFPDVSNAKPVRSLDAGTARAIRKDVRSKIYRRGSCGKIFDRTRSEEHTSELQSHLNLVCRLLLEKKKKILMLCTNNQRNQYS